MRRMVALLSLCALLTGGLFTGAYAQQIAIAGGDLLDVSLRDADLATVLTALFNSTNGKCQYRLGSGVTGRITRLQLAQTPFDKALDAILGTDYSYAKQPQSDGVFLYTISGRQGGSTYAPRMPAVLQAPPIGLPSFNTTETPGASGPFRGTGAGTTSPLLTLSPRDSTMAGATAASESSVVKLLRIQNVDVMVLCDFLGGQSIDLFELLNSGTGGTNTGGGRRSGGNLNNNNNNNNNYNNNNNNTRNNNNNTRNNNNNNRTY